jgi:hypothetical protein
MSILHDTITEFETYDELKQLVIEGAEESPEVKLGGPFSTDFEDDTIGNDPAGFTDVSGVWAVQNDGGNQVVKNSGDGLLRATAPGICDNYKLKFKVKFVSGTYNRWLVYPRYLDTNNKIKIGCNYANDVIDIYETVGGVDTRVAYSAYTYGTGLHNVEIICQDGCIVVTIGTTTIKYESLSVLKNCAGVLFQAHSGSINEFDDIDFVNTYHQNGEITSDELAALGNLTLAWDQNANATKDDNFADGSLDAQWAKAMGSITGTDFEETGGELKYSGTPLGNGYCAIYTPYTNKRLSWFQQIRFKAPTAIALGKEILFRMDADSTNFVEISIQADGYRVEKVEDGEQPAGSVTGPTALFGNEDTTFHTLKILWDEENSKVYGWVDNKYIGSLSVDTATFPDKQRFILHINNANGSAIDRRFDDFICSNTQVQLLTRTGAVTPADESWEGWKPSADAVVVDACDDEADWATNDAVNFAKSQETTIKQEGTGSLKVVATTSAKDKYCDIDISALDLSEKSYISFWIRSDRVGKYLQMQVGESDLAGAGAVPMIYDIDIREADTWQQEFWDLSRISPELRDAIVYICLKCISASAVFTCYLDDIKSDVFFSNSAGAESTSTPNTYMQYKVVLSGNGYRSPIMTSLTIEAIWTAVLYIIGNFDLVCGGKGYLLGDINLVDPTEWPGLRYLLGSIDLVNERKGYLLGDFDLTPGGKAYLQGVISLVDRLVKPSAGSYFLRTSSVRRNI